MQWYDNTLGVDEYTRFPMHLLVEEGKHATCTDKNADGYYTPNYDVNRRVNDAWAVRDVIRGGTLYTGGYQSWVSKVRQPQHRVFPPLPNDSPLRRQFVKSGEYAPDQAVYVLRPFPSAEKAPHDLVHFIADKGDPNWPAVAKNTGRKQFSRWIDTYFSAGAEWDREPAPEGSEKKYKTTADFVLETGIKFRYVIEFGAGTW
jgi:hypothetical protein